MIKLNNKNITYVALADTNNSVKGVKEIWYADTNNSVKLVYRRKDALIEGEDYEKYHWLVGDADAYINTLKYYRPYDDSVQMTFRDNLYPNRVSKYNKHNVEEHIWGACIQNTNLVVRSYISGTGYNSTNKIGNNIIDSRTTDSDVNWGGYMIRSFINASPEHSLYISSVDANTDKYYFIYNGDTKGNLPTRYTLPEIINQDVCVFYANQVTNGYFNGSFSNFIHYRNNVEITHFIPCKLLKPVPKWLDANGIRRQVGECGMIDLISGKFYGNVNSNGTFTVENYYERKEWLIANIPVGGDMMTLNLNDATTVSFQRFYSQSGNTYLFKSSSYLYTIKDNVNNLRCWNTNTSSVVFEQQVSTDGSYNLILSDEEYIINNISIPKYGALTNIQFYNNTNALSAAIYKNSKITVNNKERYIPCTLTMDLPASMDANNIARTKGTSGMWDLVSDRFYGNVANSGTFKAVNLAEGVDYEVHDWLYTELPEANKFMILPIGSDTFSFNRVFYKTNSVGFFRTNGYLYYSSQQRIRLWDINSSRMLFSSSPYQYGELIQVISNSNSDSVTIKDSSIPKYAYDDLDSIVVDFREAYTDGNFASKFKTSKITVDGVDRYIPVKLLRSIPSKYDANGRARQAGECGMYDTVNDVFYGNVANSGTFSVSD